MTLLYGLYLRYIYPNIERNGQKLYLKTSCLGPGLHLLSLWLLMGVLGVPVASFGATLGCLCLAGDDFGVPWGAFGSLWAAFGGARGSFSKRLVVHFPKCLKLDPPAGLKTLFQQMFFSSNKFQKE